MQNKPSNDQHKSIYYRLRRSDPHERLSARLRHFSFGAAVFFVVAAAGIVTHSLYNIQIKQGATFRQYAAQQQLLDSTIQATRGEIYDASGITLASTSVVWTIWADPSYSRHHAGVHQRSMDHLGRPQLQHGPLHQPDRRGDG